MLTYTSFLTATQPHCFLRPGAKERCQNCFQERCQMRHACANTACHVAQVGNDNSSCAHAAFKFRSSHRRKHMQRSFDACTSKVSMVTLADLVTAGSSEVCSPFRNAQLACKVAGCHAVHADSQLLHNQKVSAVFDSTSITEQVATHVPRSRD